MPEAPSLVYKSGFDEGVGNKYSNDNEQSNMKVFSSKNLDKGSSTFCKVEMTLSSAYNGAYLKKLLPIDEDGNNQIKDLDFFRVTKIHLQGSHLTIYQSTKRVAQPILTISLKKYDISWNNNVVILQSRKKTTNPSSVKLHLKSSIFETWKKVWEASLPNTNSENIYKKIQNKLLHHKQDPKLISANTISTLQQNLLDLNKKVIS